MKPPCRALLQGLALSLLLLLALTVRLVGSGELFDGPRTRLVDADSQLHAWRMAQVLRSFPALPPATLKQIAHPDGAVLDWPPGLDYLGGALAWLGGLAPDGEQAGRLGTLLVALLGALCIPLAARLAWRFVRLRWAVLAGLLLALWPAHVEFGHVGRVDHRTAEALLALVVILLYLGATDRRRGWLRLAVGCGIAAGLLVWVSPTPLVPLGLLGLGMVLHNPPDRHPALAPVVLAVATATAAPPCLTPPHLQQWTLIGPSPAQLLALGALLALALWAVGARRWVSRRWLRGLGLLGLSLLALALLPLADTLKLAADARAVPWDLPLARQPLWVLPPEQSVVLLGYLVAALPLLVALALAAPLARRRELQLLSLWAGAFVLVGVLRVGYLPLALCVSAPLCAIGLAQASRRAVAWLRGRARPALVATVGPVVGLGALCLLWPAADYLVDGRARRVVAPGGEDVERAARWLRQQPTDPTRPAVLAPPELGTVVLNLGRARVVGAPIVVPTTDVANRAALTMLINRDPGVAEGLLQSRGIGWILVRPLSTPQHARILRHLGRHAGRLSLFHFHRHTLAVRLLHDMGSGAELLGDYLPAVDWLQHVWESPPIFGTPPTHLFRVVRGARLVGSAPPWAMVDLQVRLVTHRGGPLEYLDRQRADASGRFVFRVPYWSSATVPREVRRYLAALVRLRERFAQGERGLKPPPLLDRPTFTPLGLFRVTSGRTSATIHVPRAAVLSGSTVTVHLPAPPAR